MDNKYIMAQVYMAGLFGTGMLCDSVTAEPVSADLQILGEEWFVPFIEKGVFDRYVKVVQPLAPTDDAVRVVRLRDADTGETKWILGEVADWVDLVNACCGDTTAMPTITLPAVMLEEFPCAVAVCTPGTPSYTYRDVFPALAAGEKYLISGSANGVAFTPTASSAGYASMAAAVAAANTLWSAYGTFTLTDTDGFTLVSTTATHGNVAVNIKPAP